MDPLAALADDPAIAFLAQVEHERKQALERYREHPFLFLAECVETIDQATGSIRKYPHHAPTEHKLGECSACYLEAVVREWQANRLFLMVKSRRMLATWTFVALHVWLCLFRPMTKVAFCARKQGMNEAEGSAELVWRAKFIVEHLPQSIAVPFEYKFLHLAFPASESEIVGVGEGPDQLRQHTLTAIFADELGFWDRAFDTYVAARPTIEGGGRFTGVSTPAPGFFKDLIFDKR